MKPLKTDPLEPKDLQLLRSLSGAGMFLKLVELAGDDDLEMTAEEIAPRLQALIDAGYVKCYFTATVEGSVALRAELSGR